jgi:serine phosphatase RsbU (regulator of sigma subunit)
MRIPPKTSSFLFYGITGVVLLVSLISFIKAMSWIDRPFPGFLTYKFPRVGSMGSTDWPGGKAGLRLMDKIVAVNGGPIYDGQDVVDIAKGKSPGTLVHYTVESGEQMRTISVPITKFSTIDFLIVFFLPFLGGLALLSIGSIVYILKPNVLTSWVFFFFCLVVSIYMVTGFEMQSTYLFFHLHYFVFPFQGAILFHLGSIFPEKKRFTLRHPFLEYGVYLPALILALLFELQLFTSMRTSSHALSWLPDVKAITAFSRIFILFGVIGFIVLVIHSMFKTSSNVVRLRAKMIFFGVTFAFFPTVLVFLFVHFMEISIPFNFMIFFVLFFPASMAYSIVRHNLFDADTIIRRTVGYTVVTAIVIGAYVLVSISFNVLLGQYQIAQSRAFPIVFTLAIILIFNPLRDRIQSLVDRIFFRKEYDYSEIVNRIGGAMTSLMDLGQILRQMVSTFMKDMFIETSSIMLLSPTGTGYQVFLADGERKMDVEQVTLQRDQPLIQIIEKDKKELTRYDILEDPKYKTVCQECVKDFEILHASLMVPLVFQDKVIGLINLGEKKSGKFYNREDIDLLHTLASQGAVAIENAKLMEENIQKSRMEEELKIAHDIQLSMLPEKAPLIEGISVAARSIPAREVGGDFYDFIEIQDKEAKRLGIIVGDVSGKAVSGALVMAASRSIFRVLTETHESVEEVMNRGNLRLHQDVKKGMFVALLYAVLDPKEKLLTFSNAGQVQPILFSAGKSKAEYIDTEGDRFPLGIVKKCHYQATQVALQQGDILVFYTDGIVEAVNEKGELYGFERFLASIEEGRELGTDELLEKLIKDVMQYVGKVEQHDDLTVVVVRVE